MDETTTVLQITSMLDRHLAEHLDDVSVIVVQKVGPTRQGPVLPSNMLTPRVLPAVLVPILLACFDFRSRMVFVWPSLFLLRLDSPANNSCASALVPGQVDSSGSFLCQARVKLLTLLFAQRHTFECFFL